MQKACESIENTLQHLWGKELVQHFFQLAQVFYMQDAKRTWLVRLHQQSQIACGSICLLGGDYEKWGCGDDLALELATIP